jgi:hypothetical protein
MKNEQIMGFFFSIKGKLKWLGSSTVSVRRVHCWNWVGTLSGQLSNKLQAVHSFDHLLEPQLNPTQQNMGLLMAELLIGKPIGCL